MLSELKGRFDDQISLNPYICPEGRKRPKSRYVYISGVLFMLKLYINFNITKIDVLKSSGHILVKMFPGTECALSKYFEFNAAK